MNDDKQNNNNNRKSNDFTNDDDDLIDKGKYYQNPEKFIQEIFRQFNFTKTFSKNLNYQAS